MSMFFVSLAANLGYFFASDSKSEKTTSFDTKKLFWIPIAIVLIDLIVCLIRSLINLSA
jgi:hypothetical protein